MDELETYEERRQRKNIEEVIFAAREWKRIITGNPIDGAELSSAQYRLLDAVEAYELSR